MRKWVFSHWRRTKVRISPHLRVRAVVSASYSVHLEICWKSLKKNIATPDQTVLTVTCANSMSIWHIDIFSGSNNNNNMFCENFFLNNCILSKSLIR